MRKINQFGWLAYQLYKNKEQRFDWLKKYKVELSALLLLYFGLLGITYWHFTERIDQYKMSARMWEQQRINNQQEAIYQYLINGIPNCRDIKENICQTP